MDRVPTETIPDAVSIDICVSMVTRCRRLSRVQAKTGDRGCSGMTRCRIPDDYIDARRYPLLAAREVMRQVVDDLLGRSTFAPGALA